MSRANRFYLFVAVFLVVAVIAGGVMLIIKHREFQPVEIALRETVPCQQSMQVYIGGAVINPGIYFLEDDDTMEAILSDVGLESSADLSHIKIYIPKEDEVSLPQRIDINRAESWLLEALPGIGEGRAQDIVNYRNENGHFRRIEDLCQVKGIGDAIFEKVKDYITVSD